jgi:Na+/glutamate symporter
MENIQTILAAILPAVLILMVITNIIVEVLKKLTWDKVPTNVMAFITAMAVTLLAFFAVCKIKAVPIAWYMVVAAVCLGFFVAFAAMFGFDKFRQTLEQITNVEKRKE